jgi:phosphatidylinositol phospholipase C, delta
MDRAQRRKGLTFEQCATFLHKVKRDSWIVKPVNVIWDDLFGENMNNGKPRMTVSAQSFLKMFLHGKQGEGHRTLTDVERIFASLHEMEMPYRAPLEIDFSRIDKNHFEAYLLSRHNDAFDPERENFDPNLMMKPIAEYWINSSHNTYLTGDQFTSHSSVQMYMDALYRGCRCLELDIWDGETDSSARPVPVVWHGHTMTSKILFVDILHCFKVFLNLHPQTYPIVLSFENHCSLPYQDVMAEDLQRVLGDKLYIPTENSLFERLPSPEA